MGSSNCSKQLSKHDTERAESTFDNITELSTEHT